MNVRPVFYTEADTLRAGWRAIGFLIAAPVGVVVVAGVVGPGLGVVLRVIGLRGDATEYWSDMLGILAATMFMLRVIDNRPWRDIWLGENAAQPQRFVIGFVVGVVAIALPILALVAVHWLRIDREAAGSWWLAALRLSVTLLPAALAEELLTRGYLLSALREAWGWRWSIAATSVGFGLLHLKNPDANVRSLGLVVLAGIFLGVVVYTTQSLYAAWMTHFAWNWMMAVVFHVSVSGISMEAPGYRYVDAGPTWATGGTWGPEGGIPAGAGMCAGMGLTYLIGRRGRKRAMRAA